MSGLGTVYKKEVRENLRDRRSLFNSVLLGPILFPILFIGLAYFTSSKQQERVEQVLEVPVVGAENAPNLVSFLEQQGVVIQTAPADPEAAVSSQDVQVIIRIPEEYAEEWKSGKPAVVELIADPSRRESDIPMQRVRGLLGAYGAQIGQLRLQLRGVAPTLQSPVMIKDVDLSTPQSRGMLVMIMLPYVLMITAFTGGMHLAIDSTAGEKERKSLEPLLINPVPRWQVMLGKMSATATFAFASLFLTLLAFRFAFPLLPTGALGVDLTSQCRGPWRHTADGRAGGRAGRCHANHPRRTCQKSPRSAIIYGSGFHDPDDSQPDFHGQSHETRNLDDGDSNVFAKPADRGIRARRNRQPALACHFHGQYAIDRPGFCSDCRQPVQPAKNRIFKLGIFCYE